MIKKLKIKNFKWIDEVVYDLGQDTIITGRNWAGKSTILDAIIRCMTWIVNWAKKKLDATVTIEWDTYTTTRVKGKILGTPPINDIQLYLASAIPWYINTLTTKDKLRVMLTQYTSKEWYCANWIVNNDEDVVRIKKKVKEQKKYADVYWEELVDINNKLIDIWDVNVWSLPELKKRYDDIIEHKTILSKNADITFERWTLEQEVWDFLLDHSLNDIREDLISKRNNVSTLEIKRAELKIKYTKLKEWKCYTCWSDITDKDELNRVTIEWKKVADELSRLDINDINNQIEVITKKQNEYQTKLMSYNKLQNLSDIYEVPDIKEYTEEELEDLTLKLSNFEELFAKQQQKKLLEDRAGEIKTKLWDMTYMSLQDGLDSYKKSELIYYKSLTTNVNSKFDFDIELFKENTTNDWFQPVFNISKDWVDYFWLSTAEKWLIDIQLSKSLWTIDYILIDNWERFTTKNIKKIFEIMWDQQVIITKVSQAKLVVENT